LLCSNPLASSTLSAMRYTGYPRPPSQRSCWWGVLRAFSCSLHVRRPTEEACCRHCCANLAAYRCISCTVNGLGTPSAGWARPLHQQQDCLRSWSLSAMGSHLSHQHQDLVLECWAPLSESLVLFSVTMRHRRAVSSALCGAGLCECHGGGCAARTLSG